MTTDKPRKPRGRLAQLSKAMRLRARNNSASDFVRRLTLAEQAKRAREDS